MPLHLLMGMPGMALTDTGIETLLESLPHLTKLGKP